MRHYPTPLCGLCRLTLFLRRAANDSAKTKEQLPPRHNSVTCFIELIEHGIKQLCRGRSGPRILAGLQRCPEHPTVHSAV